MNIQSLSLYQIRQVLEQPELDRYLILAWKVQSGLPLSNNEYMDLKDLDGLIRKKWREYCESSFS